MTLWLWILLALFIVISVVMVLIILMQRPQGGGLAGAFGGAGGGTDSVFGGRIGDALTWTTAIAFVLYLIVAIGLNVVDDQEPAPAQPALTSTDDGTGTTGTTAVPISTVPATPTLPPPGEETGKADAGATTKPEPESAAEPIEDPIPQPPADPETGSEPEPTPGAADPGAAAP